MSDRTDPDEDAAMARAVAILSRKRPTARELQVLAAYGRSGSWKVAAYELGISVQTVKNTASSIMRKTGASTSVGAMSRLGWIVPEGNHRTNLAHLRDMLREMLLDVEDELG